MANSHAVTLCVALWAAIGSAGARCLDVELVSTESERRAAGPTTRDDSGRIVAPVTISRQGPFRFLVDTGASRSALAPHLVQRLKLAPATRGEVHSIHDMVIAPMVRVDALGYGGVTLTSGLLPVIEGPVLAGLDGLLGVDALRGRLFHMDFDRQCLEIAPVSRARGLQGWVRVPGVLRFGHLVVMPGRIEGWHVNVIVDTGSDSTLANIILRERLRLAVRPGREPAKQTRGYTAGEPVVLESAVLIPSIWLGDLTAKDVVAYIGDFHIFGLLGLRGEPTVLVGMDVLSQSSALAIDYEHGIVYFRLRRRGR